MYSYEDRKKAIELLIKYDLCYATVIRELGYPSKGSLRNWYYAYKAADTIKSSYSKKSKYSFEEKQKAVNYYIEHGKNIRRTVRILGYPSRTLLDKWICEIAPSEKKYCGSDGTNIHYTQQEKENAVISFKTRNKPAKEVAEDYGTTRSNLYVWERKLTYKEFGVNTMNRNEIKSTNSQADEANLHAEKKTLEQQVKELQNEVHQLKIKRDIYEKAVDVLKR